MVGKFLWFVGMCVYLYTAVKMFHFPICPIFVPFYFCSKIIQGCVLGSHPPIPLEPFT